MLSLSPDSIPSSMETPGEFFDYLEQSLARIAHEEASGEQRIADVYRLVSLFFQSIGEDEHLHFTTLFARISHAVARHRIPWQLARAIQLFRIDAEDYLRKGVLEPPKDAEHIWILGAWAMHQITAHILGLSPQDFQLLTGQTKPELPAGRPDRLARKRSARLVAFAIDKSQDALEAWDADDADQHIILRYGDAGRSELFKENVLRAVEIIGFPLTLSAVDIDIDTDGAYSPRIIVIEPDYLIDVTTIAECYQDQGGDARLYILRKYQLPRITPEMLTGHVANFFLDQLIYHPEYKFGELFPKAFFLNPTAFATFSDDDIYKIQTLSKVHFDTLKKVIEEVFPKEEIDRKRLYIEPSFYAPAYGIQGRLDLYAPGNGEHRIIELKSGQPFKANAYGLSSTHYAQTLLYDLMVRAVHDFKGKRNCYILYSKLQQGALRFAPSVEAIQREVIRLRNEILLIELDLHRQSIQSAGWFEKIHPDAFPDTTGYLAAGIARFAQTWRGLDDLEQRYFRIFSRFISREHFLAKMGVQGIDRLNGLAALWLDSDLEKEDQFAIFRDLRIQDILSGEDTILVLSKGSQTNTLANFRVGDIAVVYPRLSRQPSVLHTQIYKGTIIALDALTISVRLRSHQVNLDDIKSHQWWCLEHDLYDSSFNQLHSALFVFANYPPERRALFLGRRSPDHPDQDTPIAFDPSVGIAQQRVLQRIIAARDYFLLWGPPGTGKTSVIIHHLVRYYLTATKERILLLAYTNRAVDEICQALDAIGGDIRQKYLRIGSRYSTGEEYRDQLLDARISGLKRRKELVDLLRSQRVITGTVSSLTGRAEIFEIAPATIAIVDEASQILEPALAGMLPRFKKWVLIGDHLQLPAVVAQTPEQTSLGDDAIDEIGLTDTRDSYFERMYHLCQDHGWHWAFDRLTAQGRMHRNIMRFPADKFYDGHLELLPTDQWQGRDFTADIQFETMEEANVLMHTLATQRTVYIPSRSQKLQRWAKTHDDEARIVTDIVDGLRRIHSGRIPDLGIITPFRAQIANIRKHLEQAGIDPDQFTIDTVERYQGSARDIIVLSLSIHDPAQLRRVVSLSREGIDRKLNVAITRAREQFVLIADPAVIAANPVYEALRGTCFEVRGIS